MSILGTLVSAPGPFVLFSWHSLGLQWFENDLEFLQNEFQPRNLDVWLQVFLEFPMYNVGVAGLCHLEQKLIMLFLDFLVEVPIWQLLVQECLHVIQVPDE